MKESFVIFKSFYEPIKNLSFEEKGKLFDAIFQYQITETEPENTSNIYMAFLFFKNQFRLDEKKYNSVVERNKSNGIKGGRPSKPKKPSGLNENPKNPVGAKKADNDNDNDNDNVFIEIDKSISLSFENFRLSYPGSKRGHTTEIENLKKRHADWREILPQLEPAVKNQIESRSRNTLAGKFVPEWKNMVTWINQRCWEELSEVIPPPVKKVQQYITAKDIFPQANM